jgi:predicted SAM-dependent methyltransferase
MTKSHPARLRAGDYEWIKGIVLDIGCGPDPIKGSPSRIVRPWDLADGDATFLATIDDKSVDTITASHVLEHLADPETTLQNWSRVLKEGSYCYILVPLFSAYEKFKDFQFGTPNAGKFNPDHKTSWDLINLVERPKNHRHFGYKEIVMLGKQAGLTLVDLRMELDGYKWERFHDLEFDQTQHGALAQLAIIYQKI